MPLRKAKKAAKPNKTSDVVLSEVRDAGERARAVVEDLASGSKRTARKAVRTIDKATTKAERRARKVRRKAERRLDRIRRRAGRRVDQVTDRLRPKK